MESLGDTVPSIYIYITSFLDQITHVGQRSKCINL